MSVLIVTHPHSHYNADLFEEEYRKFLTQIDFPAYYIPDGDRRPFGGKKLYAGRLKAKDGSLDEIGRASLKDEDANTIVDKNEVVFLAGGNLSECLASTFDSLVRACERLGKEINVLLIDDLIYLQKKDGLGTMQEAERNDKLHLYMSDKNFWNSEKVNYGRISSERVIEEVKS